MSFFNPPRGWRPEIVRAWREEQFLEPAKLAGSLGISTLNLLWQGHGIMRLSPPVWRFAGVAVLSYVILVLMEILWLLFAVPAGWGVIDARATAAAAELTRRPEPVDPLVEELRALPHAELKQGTLELAEEMRTFEAGSDGAYLTTLLRTRTLRDVTEDQRDEELDRESKELMHRHLATWRVYRECFHRPARAFRDELRNRLGIRYTGGEPEIPALDDATLTGVSPITEAADYLDALARRLS